MYRFSCIFISAAPALFGLIIMFNAFSDLNTSRSAESWPSVPGTITENQKAGMLSYYRKSSFLSYRYTVGSNQYVGSRVSFGGSDLSNYSPYQSVEVFYNPEDYQDTVLEVGFHLGYMLRMLFGLSMLFVGKYLWDRLK